MKKKGAGKKSGKGKSKGDLLLKKNRIALLEELGDNLKNASSNEGLTYLRKWLEKMQGKFSHEPDTVMGLVISHQLALLTAEIRTLRQIMEGKKR